MNEHIKRESALILRDQETGWFSIPEIQRLLSKYSNDRDFSYVPPFEEIREIVEELGEWIEAYANSQGFITEDILVEVAEYIVRMYDMLYGYCDDHEAYEVYADQHYRTWHDEAVEYMTEDGMPYAEECLNDILEQEGIDKNAGDFPGIVDKIHGQAIDEVGMLVHDAYESNSIPCADSIFHRVWELFSEIDPWAIDRDELLKEIREEIEQVQYA